MTIHSTQILCIFIRCIYLQVIFYCCYYTKRKPKNQTKSKTKQIETKSKQKKRKKRLNACISLPHELKYMYLYYWKCITEHTFMSRNHQQSYNYLYIYIYSYLFNYILGLVSVIHMIRVYLLCNLQFSHIPKLNSILSNLSKVTKANQREIPN